MHASGPAVALAAPIRPIVGPGTARPAPSPLEQLSVCGVEATAMRETRLLQVALDMPGEPERGDDPLARNEEAFLAVLEEAARFDPDFVHAPELTLAYNLDRDARDVADLAHRLPGSFTDRVGERARALDSYVWVPTYERADGSVYNSVALIDPGGTYRGAYRKVAPTVTELEQRGVTPRCSSSVGSARRSVTTSGSTRSGWGIAPGASTSSSIRHTGWGTGNSATGPPTTATTSPTAFRATPASTRPTATRSAGPPAIRRPRPSPSTTLPPGSPP